MDTRDAVVAAGLESSDEEDGRGVEPEGWMEVGERRPSRGWGLSSTSEEEGGDGGGVEPHAGAGEDQRIPKEDVQGAGTSEKEVEETHEEPKEALPPLKAPLVDLPGRDAQACHLKTSNLVDVELTPFDPDTFEEEPQVFVDENGRERVKMRGHNVVRWRKRVQEDGKECVETNAKFVRWSDGSLQLFLGEDVLDVVQQDIGRDHRHLYVRHPESLIQAQAKMNTRLVFHPSSLMSKSHKRLTAALGKRHGKVSKVVRMDELNDPEKQKEEWERAEEKRIRERENMQKKQERQMRKYERYGRSRPRYEPRGLTADFLEEDDEMEYEEITAEGAREAIRNVRRPMTEEEEEEAERQLLHAKESKPHVPPLKRYRDEVGGSEPSEEAEGSQGGDDREEEEEMARKKSRKGKVLDLSDDED
eukprot:scaffold598_cov318-Pavlova_lutheri.AAC.28